MRKVFCVFFGAVLIPAVAFGAQAPNLRSIGGAPVPAGGVPQPSDATIRIGSNPTAPAAGAPTPTAMRAAVTSTRGAVVSRAAVPATVLSRGPVSATPGVSARAGVVSTVRAPVSTGVTARAATLSTVARAATPIYNDLSKMGAAYTACATAYNTCMDQFCANKSDVYRRCICSDQFKAFSAAEDKFAQAKTMLQTFADTNLTAVTLSASEVTAQNTATAGEKALSKVDVSATTQLLNNISDLLAGKTSAAPDAPTKLDFSDLLDFSSVVDNIWAGNDGTDIFGGSGTTNLATMEGQALYTNVDRQCATAPAIKSACDDASLKMARSAYTILISQDCSTFEKKVNADKQAVADKVRQAYNALRNARLQEYHDHNSADMNACIAAVRTAILDPNACGPNWIRCLDLTGKYINNSTGQPILSPEFFKLSTLITLSDNINTNAASAGAQMYMKALDGYKIHAAAALDSCRDIAGNVWTEFKNQAIIEISQAQDQKVQDVKDSCVATIKQCYDTQSGAMAGLDTTIGQTTDAINAVAASAMCKDQVATCANLFGGTCATATTDKATLQTCGLESLLKFVAAVDTASIAEGCETALNNYIKQTCTPTVSGQVFPAACRSLAMGLDAAGTTCLANAPANTLCGMLKTYAASYCLDGTQTVISTAAAVITKVVGQVSDQLGSMLQSDCATANGVWMDASMIDATKNPTLKNNVPAVYLKILDTTNNAQLVQLDTTFYSADFGGRIPSTITDLATITGACVQFSAQLQCSNPGVSCNSRTGQITLDDDWYKDMCTGVLGGKWDTNLNACLYGNK